MSQKILVTGGAGFIGSHLVDALIQKRYRVVVMDNLTTGFKRNVNPNAKFYKVDIKSKKVADIFKKEKFDYVFHLAAQMDVRHSVADPLYDAEVNILGSLNLMRNAAKYKVKKFIFASSGGAIYGQTKNLPTPEKEPTNPISPYGVSKLASEKYLFYFQQEFGLPYVSLRYANVYGPRQRSDGEAGVVAIFTDKILAGKQAVINGDGRNTRDYVYVGDVVRANLLALKSMAKGAYNIGAGKETTVNKVFKTIVKTAGVSAKTKNGPAKPGEQRRSVLSYRKIYRELGWRPKINFKEGIKRTVVWFRKNMGK